MTRRRGLRIGLATAAAAVGLVPLLVNSAVAQVVDYEAMVVADGPLALYRFTGTGNSHSSVSLPAHAAGGDWSIKRVSTSWTPTYGATLVDDATSDGSSTFVSGSTQAGWITLTSTGLDSGDMPEEFALEAWVQLAAEPSCTGTVFARSYNQGGAADNSGYILRVTKDRKLGFDTKRQGSAVAAADCFTGSDLFSSVGAISIGGVHHVVAHYVPHGNGTTATTEIWIDGLLAGTKTTAEHVTTGRGKGLSIGSRTGGTGVDPTQLFVGQIDEAAYYDRVLTEAEIADHFNKEPLPLPGTTPVPDYRCGRTIRQVGGGQYFVDLEAVNMFPAQAGLIGGDFSGYSDGSFEWQLSWGGTAPAVQFDGFDGERVTNQIPARVTAVLPALSTMPPGGWTATFRVLRTIYEASPSGTWSNLGDGDFHELDQDGPTGPLEPQPWWVPNSVWALWESIPAWMKEGTVLTPGGVSYTGNTGDHWLPGTAVALGTGGGDFVDELNAAWRSASGTCTITINPLEPGNGAEGETGPPPVVGGDGSPIPTTTIPTTSTTLPAGDNDSQGEDGTRNDCSAGFLGRIPLIGGAFEGVARLVCALKQLLVELFVPDDWGTLVDLGEFNTRFPGSWVAEGVSGVDTLKDQISTGAGGSACGPVMEMPEPLGMTVRLPSPSSCGGSGSTVTEGYSEAFELFGYRTALRAALTAFLYLGVVWRLMRLVPWGGGRDDGGPTF